MSWEVPDVSFENEVAQDQSSAQKSSFSKQGAVHSHIVGSTVKFCTIKKTVNRICDIA